MKIRYHCPTDGCVAIIEYEPLEECGETMECPRCHTKHPMKITDTMRNKHTVDRCAVCGCGELFKRKDFPQRLGLAIVFVFGIVAIYFFATSLIIAWIVLASAVLLDVLIYAVIGRVTACYNCRAEYRGLEPDDTHGAFDLATAEKY